MAEMESNSPPRGTDASTTATLWSPRRLGLLALRVLSRLLHSQQPRPGACEHESSRGRAAPRSDAAEREWEIQRERWRAYAELMKS